MLIQNKFHRLPEEISTFCPVRFSIGDQNFDGLLDTLDSRGGSFFILIEDDPLYPGTPIRSLFETEDFGELILGNGAQGIRVLCTIQDIHIDQDGLFAYIGLDFMEKTAIEKNRLENFIASLW